MKILDIHGLSKSFSGVKALNDVSLFVKERQIVSLIGPNGAGKTTLFNVITGVYQADAGQVLVSEKDVTKLPQYQITHEGLGRTFQNIRLFQGLNVLENVMTASDPILTYPLISGMLTLPGARRVEKKNRDLAMHYLELTGMAKYADSNPFSLPYGLQRKLEIARALATQPKVLLLDEPGAGLNPTEICELIDLLNELHTTMDLSILLIDHRMQLIMTLSDYIYVLNFGNLLAQGTPIEIQENPEVNRAYMGDGGVVCCYCPSET